MGIIHRGRRHVEEVCCINKLVAYRIMQAEKKIILPVVSPRNMN